MSMIVNDGPVFVLFFGVYRRTEARRACPPQTKTGLSKVSIWNYASYRHLTSVRIRQPLPIILKYTGSLAKSKILMFRIQSYRFITTQISLSNRGRSLSIMSTELIPSNPSDVMVIRNVTPNVVTFSVPFARFGKAKIGGRGTLVKLTSGSLAAFSPVALTDATKAKVTEMGGLVRYLVALDIEHHIFLSEWAKEYPDAKIIGPHGLPEKRAQQNDPKIGQDAFSVVFTPEKKHETKIGEEFDTDFDYEYVDGHANRELVFYYKPEKVLIEADLLFNLPATEQYSRVPESERQSSGVVDKLFAKLQSTEGEGKWIKRFNWYVLAKDRPSYNDSLRVISGWDFITLIPCHGDVIEGDAKQVFDKVFNWHLGGRN